MVDASALVELLLQTPRAASVRQAVGDTEMVAVDLVNAEVLSTLRRLEHSGGLSCERAAEGVLDLREAPLRRVPTASLLEIAWTLRANVSAYDACYVALARVLECPLVTADRRLARAPELGVATLGV